MRCWAKKVEIYHSFDNGSGWRHLPSPSFMFLSGNGLNMNILKHRTSIACLHSFKAVNWNYLLLWIANSHSWCWKWRAVTVFRLWGSYLVDHNKVIVLTRTTLMDWIVWQTHGFAHFWVVEGMQAAGIQAARLTSIKYWRRWRKQQLDLPAFYSHLFLSFLWLRPTVGNIRLMQM